MKRKISNEVKKCIEELYANEHTQAEIRFLLDYECGIKVPYHVISDLKPSRSKLRKAYVYAHNRKAHVMKKRSIQNRLPIYILDLFDGGRLSATQIRTKINEKFGVTFGENLEKHIDNVIKDFEKKLGKDSPVVCVKPFVYRLNKRSPYKTICGGLEAR